MTQYDFDSVINREDAELSIVSQEMATIEEDAISEVDYCVPVSVLEGVLTIILYLAIIALIVVLLYAVLIM